MGIIAWIIVGIVAGWLAEKIMGRNHGLVTNLVVGVLGALIGGWLAGQFIPGFGSGLIGSIIVATLGACLLLFLVGLVKRRG